MRTSVTLFLARLDFGTSNASTGESATTPFVKFLSLPSSDQRSSIPEFQAARSAALDKLPPTLKLGDIATASSGSTVAHSDHAGASATTDADPPRNGLSNPALGLLIGGIFVVVILCIIGGVLFLKWKRTRRGPYETMKD